MQTKLYYSIQDGGDGSAYPRFFLTEEQASVDQDSMLVLYGHGWGEECTGSLTVDSEAPVTFTNITSLEEQIKDFEDDLEYHEAKEPLQKLIDRLKALQ